MRRSEKVLGLSHSSVKGGEAAPPGNCTSVRARQIGTGTFPRERGWEVRAPALIYSVFQDSVWYHSLSCQRVGNTALVLLGSSVPALANMHHCPVPLSQGTRGAPAHTCSCWVLLSAPELPDARAPQQACQAEDLLVHREILMPNTQMGTFKTLLHQPVANQPLFLSCAKNLQRENSWRVMISKLSHAGGRLEVFMVGWGISLHISWGFTVPKHMRVCKRVSGSNWSFPQFSQQSWIPLASTPTPTQGLGCPSHNLPPPPPLSPWFCMS